MFGTEQTLVRGKRNGAAVPPPGAFLAAIDIVAHPGAAPTLAAKS
jgi:hypothetical protein